MPRPTTELREYYVGPPLADLARRRAARFPLIVYALRAGPLMPAGCMRRFARHTMLPVSWGTIE